MRSKAKFQVNWKLLGSVLLTLAAFHSKASAQRGGEDAVWCTLSSNCTNPGPIPSPAYVDASVFGGGSDVCQQIRLAYANIQQYAPTLSGVVIDARGVGAGSPT